MPWREATPEDGEIAFESGCLIWTGYVDPSGIPVVRTATSNTTVARKRWEAEHGPVPQGKQLASLCGTRLCVRTTHREPMTHRQISYRSGIMKLTPKRLKAASALAKRGYSNRRRPRSRGGSRTGERRREGALPAPPQAVVQRLR